MKKDQASMKAAGILILNFMICRFLFFNMHGMKSWPVVLLFAGIVIIVISGCFQWKRLPFFVAVGYLLAFGVGLILQKDYADETGRMTRNDMWIIWTTIYAVLIILGIVIEKRDFRDRKLKNIVFYLILVLDFYVVPWVISASGSAMTVMLLILPGICFLTSFMYGVKNGFHFSFSLSAALLFIPSIFLFYNATAWIYVIFYGIVAIAGNLAALTVRNDR